MTKGAEGQPSRNRDHFAPLSRRELVIYDKHPSGDMASPRSQNHNAQAAMENRRRYPNHE
jgi:hypothetical protein